MTIQVREVPPTWIAGILLENYCGVTGFSIKLHQKLTVLTGDYAHVVLKASLLFLRDVGATLVGKPGLYRVQPEETTAPREPWNIRLWGSLQGQAVLWASSLDYTTHLDKVPEVEPENKTRSVLLTSFPGVRRHVNPNFISVDDPKGLPGTRVSAEYITCMLGAAVDFCLRDTAWALDTSNLLDFPFEPKLFLKHPERGTVAVPCVGGSLQRVVELVFYLAYSALTANPHLGSQCFELTPGLVLIDEIEQGLTPACQQTVLADLQVLFPLMQFIITTNSPVILSSAPSESVRVVRQTYGIEPSIQTLGSSPDQILELVYSLNSTPEYPETKCLREYERILAENAHTSPKGRMLLDQVMSHFGDRSPQVLTLKNRARLVDFKSKLQERDLSEEGSGI